MTAQQNGSVKIVWVLFAGLALVHLAAQLAGADTTADVTQWFLVPELAAVLWLSTSTSAPRSRLVVVTLVALGFSWLGDTAPDLASGDTAFLLMVGFFLLTQLAYIVAFVPFTRDGVIRRHGALVSG